MKRLTTAICWAVLGASVFAQGATGAIRGKLTETDGNPATAVALTVEAKNTATGTVYKAPVGSKGEYTLAALPPGSYDISIPTAFGVFTEAVYVAFDKKGVALQAGQTLTLDVVMKVMGNLATLGDNPSAMLTGMLARAKGSTAPTPRMADGKPDFSGVWLNVPQGSAPPLPMQQWVRDAQKVRQEKGAIPNKALCLPSGVLQIWQELPYQIVQSPTSMTIVQEYDFPGWQQIFLDGRAHPAGRKPTAMGHSTGTWDGDTLVVDTVSVSDRGPLAGAPHSDQLHIVQRFRRPDASHLEIEITAEDPGALTGVWKRSTRAMLGRDDEQVFEYLCENNTAPLHMQSTGERER